MRNLSKNNKMIANPQKLGIMRILLKIGIYRKSGLPKYTGDRVILIFKSNHISIIKT